jgi:predicted Na+-dependent transporter
MILIAVVFLGALSGFIYGSYTDGFIFSQKICLFAGLTLIMPSLFKFELRDITLLWKYKSVMLKGFVLNYVILPAIALAIGLISGDFGIAAGVMMLALFSGGGMVMHWIKRSGGDTSLGFLLLFVNVVAISLSLLILHLFATYFSGYFDVTYDEEITVKRFAWAVAELLIIIPFIASRIVRRIPGATAWFERFKKPISQISIFIILFYLFGLQSSQSLVDIYDFEPELFIVAAVATVVFYIAVYMVSVFAYRIDSAQERAAFWHTVTRYLTLALVIATFTVTTFGASMLLPVMFGYLVQIPLAVMAVRRFERD